MTAMEDLFALQDEDVLRGQLEYRRARLPEADAVLAAETARVQMSAEVGDLQIQRLDHARRQNRFEGEVAAIEIRLGELDQRLYGSAITSPKEATALQNEIGSLRRRQDDLEGQILEIMEILEPTDARLEELAAAAKSRDVKTMVGLQSRCHPGYLRLKELIDEGYVGEGVSAHLINGPEELDYAWLKGVENVGITSGASTPELLVEAVVKAIEPDEVVMVEGAEEDVSFVLPNELR